MSFFLSCGWFWLLAFVVAAKFFVSSLIFFFLCGANLRAWVQFFFCFSLSPSFVLVFVSTRLDVVGLTGHGGYCSFNDDESTNFTLTVPSGYPDQAPSDHFFVFSESRKQFFF